MSLHVHGPLPPHWQLLTEVSRLKGAADAVPVLPPGAIMLQRHTYMGTNTLNPDPCPPAQVYKWGVPQPAEARALELWSTKVPWPAAPILSLFPVAVPPRPSPITSRDICSPIPRPELPSISIHPATTYRSRQPIGSIATSIVSPHRLIRRAAAVASTPPSSYPGRPRASTFFSDISRPRLQGSQLAVVANGRHAAPRIIIASFTSLASRRDSSPSAPLLAFPTNLSNTTRAYPAAHAKQPSTQPLLGNGQRSDCAGVCRAFTSQQAL